MAPSPSPSPIKGEGSLFSRPLREGVRGRGYWIPACARMTGKCRGKFETCPELGSGRIQA